MLKRLSIIVGIITVFGFAISSCGGGEAPVSDNGTIAPQIVAPATDAAELLVGAPVQVLSVGHGDASRVELLVQAAGDEGPLLIRADRPTSEGSVLQAWTPGVPGSYTISTATYPVGDGEPIVVNRVVNILANTSVALTVPQQTTSQDPVALQLPTPTPAPAPEQPAPAPANGAAEPTTVPEPTAAVVTVPTPQVIVVAANPADNISATPTIGPTPIAKYPPPPPAPGVPLGLTQQELPASIPPVCDAAQYLGVYASDTTRRIVITEPDDVGAKTVGGTTVFRAWRLQNIGLCTWGTGYELAFYGGRNMGSGGVAFESTFPGEPARRNALVDQNRLIVPEGQPNQVAVLEVQLDAPVTPGIHQSYWRMRNPKGEYFGPILGVTLEVVRECAFGVYGAPTINNFRVVGVGEVYRPDNPINVMAELGDRVTLEWNIINSERFDIVFTSPTGSTESQSSRDQNSRATFTPRILGQHTIELYADNGPCTVVAEVLVDVVPPEDERFTLDLILHGTGTSSTAQVDDNVYASAAVPSNQARLEIRHYDPNVASFSIVSENFVTRETCYFREFIGENSWSCISSTQSVPSSQPVFNLQSNQLANGGGVISGAANIVNVNTYCTGDIIEIRAIASTNTGREASPQESNVIRVPCALMQSGTGPQQLPTELFD